VGVVVAVADSIPLRERKKARTRAALIEVSQRLFAEQGYTATTLDDICRPVEVTPQTLLRYFDSKAHLALAPMTDAVGELRAFLEHPDRHLPSLVVWTEYVTLEVKELQAPSSATNALHIQNLRTFRQWTEKDPVLVAMAGDVERQLRDILASALCRDWSADPGDVHAAVVAAALVAGRTAVWNRWFDLDGSVEELLDQLLDVIAYVKRRLPRRSESALSI
jgi:AcrR family transcriptional regulator